jgi:hypothetical protein
MNKLLLFYVVYDTLKLDRQRQRQNRVHLRHYRQSDWMLL